MYRTQTHHQSTKSLQLEKINRVEESTGFVGTMGKAITKRFTLSVLLASFMLANVGCYQDPIRAKLAGTWKIEHGEKLSKRVNQDE